MSVFLERIKNFLNNIGSSILTTLVKYDIVTIIPEPKITKQIIDTKESKNKKVADVIKVKKFNNIFFDMLARNNIIFAPVYTVDVDSPDNNDSKNIKTYIYNNDYDNENENHNDNENHNENKNHNENEIIVENPNDIIKKYSGIIDKGNNKPISSVNSIDAIKSFIGKNIYIL
jgi:hypothetical protein